MSGWTSAPPGLALREPEELARVARGAVAAPDRAIALRAACEAARVRVVNHALAIGARRHSAMLVPAYEGFNALVDSVLWQRARWEVDWRQRLRFVVAHELG